MELKPRLEKIIDKKDIARSSGRFKYSIMNNVNDIDNVYLVKNSNESITLETCSPAGFVRGNYKLSYKDLNVILKAIEDLWKSKKSYEYKFNSKNKEIIVKSIPSYYYKVEDNKLMYITINGKCMIYALDKYDSRRFYALIKEMLLNNKTYRLSNY